MILNMRRGESLTWTLTCNHVSKEREVRWEKQKQNHQIYLETHERQNRVCIYQTDLPRRVNHLTGKNRLTQLSELFLSPLRSSLSVAPVTLFKPCFLLFTGEKQEVLFINKPDQGHTQGNIRALPLLGLGRGSKIRDMLLVRMREGPDSKINSQRGPELSPVT